MDDTGRILFTTIFKGKYFNAITRVVHDMGQHELLVVKKRMSCFIFWRAMIDPHQRMCNCHGDVAGGRRALWRQT